MIETYISRFLPESESEKYWCSTAGGRAEIEQCRQAFLEDFQQRLLAAAPKVPMELLEVSYLDFNWYNETKGVYNVYFTLPGFFHPQTDQRSMYLTSQSSMTPTWFTSDADASRTRSRLGLAFSVLWVIERSKAESLKRRLGNPAPIQCNVTVTELEFELASLSLDASLRVSSAVLYEDKIFEREIYRFMNVSSVKPIN